MYIQLSTVLCLTFFQGLSAESKNDKPEVLIIGAGAAGLAAASKLWKNNFPVKILEAENRLGGRIHSVEFGDAKVDLGAEWIMSNKTNVAYDLVKDDNVLKELDFNYTFYTSDQSEVNEEVALKLHVVYITLLSQEVTKEIDFDINIGQYFILAYNGTIHKLFEQANETSHLRFAQMAMEMFEKYVILDSGSANWFDTSLLSSYIEDEDDENVYHFNGTGASVIVDKLLKDGPPKDAIELNKVVKKIDHTDDNEVKITCTDGTTYNAQHVIFTPSLGVLKHAHLKMFEPNLSSEKQKAIEAYGYGNVFKVFLYYNESWWNNEDSMGFTYIWTYPDRELIGVELPDTVDEEFNSWVRDISFTFSQPGNPNVIVLWFSGKHVPRIEKLSDKQLIKGIMYTMKKFLGHKYHIPKPIKIIRENWLSNPHFYGTYSYERLPSRQLSKPPMDTLATPILNKNGVPKLQFAGEATSLEAYATIHGAIETGYREADRLMKALSSQ